MSEIGRKFEKELSDRAAQGLERRLPVVCEDTDTINLADNDYLGLAHHPDVKEAAKQAIDEFGCSASASPLITGFGKAHFSKRNCACVRKLDHGNSGTIAKC